MKENILKFIQKITTKITSQFIAGLVVILPLVVSIVIIIFLLDKLDSILGPFVAGYLGIDVPGLGLISLLVAIWFIGLIATNYIGKKIISLYESILHKIPIVNTIFGGLKQISDTIFSHNNQSFKQVVAINFPFYGVYVIGFITSSKELKSNMKSKEKVIQIFVPTAPNPTSGFLMLVPVKNVIPLKISVEEALKIVISMGVVQPKEYIKTKLRLNK
ncbi:MAG: DUF502 domain-containing protein [Candidatus Goldbacteria bacterium]|nr:DUF502 domain-containing protein [Candidatus Goldiibacteriota bacterium]